MPSNQIVSIFNVLKPLELVRIADSVMLGALLVTPFGVYPSVSEPYITSYLWGYDLPIGYIGLFLSNLWPFLQECTRTEAKNQFNYANYQSIPLADVHLFSKLLLYQLAKRNKL